MYDVEIVGSSIIDKIANTDKIIEEFKEKVLPQIGNEVRRRIQNKLMEAQYKSGDGANLSRAVMVEVRRNELEVIIYNDKKIAPYAKYVEEGVTAHKMTYLKDKIIPFVIVNGKFQFAGRGSKNYGAPNKKFVKVTQNSLNQPGKWFNPGYVGKYCYRNGLRDAIVDIQKHLTMFTFRISTGEVFT